MSQKGAGNALWSMRATDRAASVKAPQKSFSSMSIRKNKRGSRTHAIDKTVYMERVVRAPMPKTSSECFFRILRYSLNI